MLDWFLEEESEIQWGCTLKMSPEVEINISRVPLDTSKPKPRNMLKQEHGLIRHCTVSAMSVSTIHTSLILQKVRQSVYTGTFTQKSFTHTLAIRFHVLDLLITGHSLIICWAINAYKTIL